jgi:hypothetical protein
MAFECDFYLDSKAVEYALSRLKAIPGATSKAAERAINRTLNKAHSEWAKAMASEYMVTGKEAKKVLIRKKVRASDLDRAVMKGESGETVLEGTVYSRRRRMELVKFTRQKKAWSEYKRKPKGGATVQVKRAGFKGVVLGTFIGIGSKTGRPHLMLRRRIGGKPAPREARMLFGPDLEQMASHTAPDIEPAMNRFFRKRFIHEVVNLVRKGAIEKYQGKKK